MAMNGVTSYAVCTSGCSMDAEEKRIAARLRQYGIKPTGDKNTDKAKLREIELREAQKQNTITNKFLTVTKGEQEKIQAQKKELKKQVNPEQFPNSEKIQRRKAAEKAEKALGEQLFLAIKMKEKREKYKNKEGIGVDLEKDKKNISGIVKS